MKKLIDADKLMKTYESFEFSSDMGDAMEILDLTPAVEAFEIDEIAEMMSEIIAYPCLIDIDEKLPKQCIKCQRDIRNNKALNCWKRFIKHYKEKDKLDEKA